MKLTIVEEYQARGRKGGRYSESHIARLAIPYGSLKNQTIKQLQDQMQSERDKYDKLCKRDSKIAERGRAICKLNIKRIAKKIHKLMGSLVDTNAPSVVHVDENIHYASINPFERIEQIADEELWYKQREEKMKKFVSVLRSDKTIRVKIQFQDDGVWYKLLRRSDVLDSVHVSQIVTKEELRQILHIGIKNLLGTAFTTALGITTR